MGSTNPVPEKWDRQPFIIYIEGSLGSNNPWGLQGIELGHGAYAKCTNGCKCDLAVHTYSYLQNAVRTKNILFWHIIGKKRIMAEGQELDEKS